MDVDTASLIIMNSEHSRSTRGSAWCTGALFVLFGLGSWVTINGIFSELPLLVQVLPEGWRLATGLSLVVQAGNVGPLLLHLIRCCLRRASFGRNVMEKRLTSVATSVILLLGVFGMIGAAVFWQDTVVLGSTRHSLPLFAFAWVTALADCTSSILFWSFVGGFRPIHVIALSVGEGLTGLIANGLSLLQEVSGGQPRFSVTVYFLILAGIVCLSLTAFHTLQSASLVQRELKEGAEGHEEQQDISDTLLQKPTRLRVITLLSLQVWLNFLLNGTGQSCLSLAAKPYKYEIYHAAQTAQMWIDPLAAILGLRLFLGLTGLIPVVLTLTACHVYMVVLSLQAVSAPGVGHAGFGGVLLVCVAGLARGLVSYSKMRINCMLQGGSAKDASRRLWLSGAAIQCGGALGAFIMYWLVNYTSWFRSA